MYKGDSTLIEGEEVDRSYVAYVSIDGHNAQKNPATWRHVLQGLHVRCFTTSFILEASFQDTTRVLTEAASVGRVDVLKGLKENVIVGRLIPV